MLTEWFTCLLVWWTTDRRRQEKAKRKLLPKGASLASLYLIVSMFWAVNKISSFFAKFWFRGKVSERYTDAAKKKKRDNFLNLLASGRCWRALNFGPEMKQETPVSGKGRVKNMILSQLPRCAEQKTHRGRWKMSDKWGHELWRKL